MPDNADTVAKYRCQTCGATKEIRDPYRRCGGNFPAYVTCGWRGCSDTARRQSDGDIS